MVIRLKINDEGLFHVGQALQQQEHFRISTPYLNLENGKVVAFEEEELQKFKGRMGRRYVEIPCTSHAELHKLLDEFVWSLDSEDARKAGEGKWGIGETLRELDKYMDASRKFSVFVAKKWLLSIGVEIAH
jgi:hypothetical protein